MSEEILSYRVVNGDALIVDVGDGSGAVAIGSVIQLEVRAVRTEFFAKVTGAFERRGNAGRGLPTGKIEAITFIVSEEEELVFENGPAHGAAKLVLRKG